MLVYIIRRVMQAALVIVVMSVLVYVGIYLVGSPVDILINPEMSQAEMEAVSRELGLDRPIWEQYFVFLNNAVHGDLGKSFVFGESALKLIVERMPATMELALVAMALSLLAGLPLGLWAGLRPDSTAGRSIMAGSILGFSLPNFWVGLMLIMIFAVIAGWLPASGRGATVDLFGVDLSLFTIDGWRHLILPAITLALSKTALVVRLTRAGVREVLPLDYIKFARAKGLSARRVVGVHLMKNILIPIVTVTGLELGSVVAFAVVTETVFAWPGMGKLLIDSIGNLDRPVVVAYLMLIVFLLVLLNLVVDILYSVLDPRVRLSGAQE
jgi:peptide/nickel transport system permease protein